MHTAATNQPLVLIILDGWGENPETESNGIRQAHTPYYDYLKTTYPSTLISASEKAVGLPEGVMGNSEIGHMNLGSGRVVYSGLTRIYQAIEDGSFFQNPAYLQAMEQVKRHGATLHLMGLLSDGAVHSDQDHLFALMRMAKDQGVQKLAIHCFLDGRDTPPHSGLKYLHALEAKIREIGIGRIASVSGRYYAMDRDRRWERIEPAFWAVAGKSLNTTKDDKHYVQDSYQRGVGDEFMVPVSVLDNKFQTTCITQNDAMIFFNFRADRAQQITRAFVDKDFSGFDRNAQELPEVFVCTSLYDKDIPAPVAFRPTYPQKVLSEVLADHGIAQLRLAETEKYAHVTYFFNGGQDRIFQGEDRVLIPSPKDVPTYDLKPEMSAFKIRDELLIRLDENKYGVVIMNFANADMVGHTAKPDAIIKAVQVIDQCLSEIIPKILSKGGTAIVTADHGNAEEMVDETGGPMTAHTLNLVPFILVSKNLKNVRLRSGGCLCDVAPTMLYLLGLKPPQEMVCPGLIAGAFSLA